jgi:hypothetical protein
MIGYFAQPDTAATVPWCCHPRHASTFGTGWYAALPRAINRQKSELIWEPLTVRNLGPWMCLAPGIESRPCDVLVFVGGVAGLVR